jgi:peptidoglycan/xylan/chitin deacetylase (PgdA/CDA1 family)
MAARSYPELVAEVARRGHEIACHGDAHRPVHSQTPDEFAADLVAARDTIERLTGRTPSGYRAPAFSITRDSAWAHDVLVDQGFEFDASQHDSPRIRRRVVPAHATPHLMELGGGRGLWEFPVAVWQTPRARVPVGGASYWGLMPTGLVLHGLDRAGPLAGLYLHPHEFDPEPLRPGLSERAPIAQRAEAELRAAQRNLARRRAPEVLRAIAGRHRLISYGDAHVQLSAGAATRS